MDVSEFDPLSERHDSSDTDHADRISTNSLPSYSEICTSTSDGVHDVQGNHRTQDLISLEHSALGSTATAFDRKVSDPTGLGNKSSLQSNLSMTRTRKSPKPARPPPPPPIKNRSASFNNLLDQGHYKQPAAVSQPHRSAPGRSSFFTSSTPAHPASEADLSRSRRSGSTLSINLPHSESDTTLLRSSAGNSSFYLSDGNMPITRQPQKDRLPHPRNMSLVDGDFSDLRGQREQMMQLYMAKREDEYTIRKPFKIFAGTWNVNGQTPAMEVTKWLSTEDLKKNPPDLYFIGFQELDLSKEAMVFAESAKEDEWIKVVEKSLPTDFVKYRLLRCQRLVGMMLLVYVKSVHMMSVRNLAFHQVGTGILGRMGNKGGVAIRFDLHHSSICVVNSHLAAHLEECKRRNEDFHSICSKLRFPLRNQSQVSIFQHDIVFWLGDLNYRIQTLDSEVVKQAIDNGGYKLLREYDQLMIEKGNGNTFLGFSEGEVNFRPTYKYNPGTDEWDTSEKCRTPAWCDRVLWWEAELNNASMKEKPTRSVDLEEYRQHMALTISDHKPVSARFHVKIKDIDVEKHQKVFEEENRRLDKLENEYLPTMTLSEQQIDFGSVKFQEAKLQTLEIENTGMIPCKFEFICRPEQPNICQKWLTITSHKGCLLPGDRCILEFEVYVNRITAPLLNSGKVRLEDILILHLVGGKDFFITVSGKYVPSCFGTAIETLCQLPKPIATATVKEIAELCARPCDINDECDGKPTLLVPKELWTLIDHLYRHAKKQADLFQQPGLHSEVEEIRDHLDTIVDTGEGDRKLPGSNHSAAEALLILLEAMPEPVITFDLYEACLRCCDTFYGCKQVLKQLRTHHRNVFQYILSFLRELLQYSEYNGLDLDLIANIFSGLILRPRSKKPTVDMRIDRERGKKFISHFLRNRYDG